MKILKWKFSDLDGSPKICPLDHLKIKAGKMFVFRC